MENWHHYSQTLKHILDFLAVGVTGGALVGFLPPFAAFLSIVWLSFQIYDRITYGPRGNKEEDSEAN